jgi:hypothetical protein
MHRRGQAAEAGANYDHMRSAVPDGGWGQPGCVDALNQPVHRSSSAATPGM